MLDEKAPPENVSSGPGVEADVVVLCSGMWQGVDESAKECTAWTYHGGGVVQ